MVVIFCKMFSHCPQASSWFPLLIVFGLFCQSSNSREADDSGFYCVHLNYSIRFSVDSGAPVIENLDTYNATNVTAESTIRKCEVGSEQCFAFWDVDPFDRTKGTFLMQGCWSRTNREGCMSEDCVANTPVLSSKVRNTTRFCCCSGNMCNINVTDNVNFTAYELLKKSKANLGSDSFYPNYSLQTIIISLSSVAVFAIIVLAVFVFVRCYCQSSQPVDAEASLFLVPPLSGHIPGLLDIDDLKLESTIHRGRYGEVYKAILNDTEVAVKSLYPSHRQYYFNERDIYVQAYMQHENITKFCGYCERQADGDTPAQYMIVTVFVELGTLTNYLKYNTVDWQTMSRMWHSMASGLAHLHTEIVVGDKMKPTVAHRDFNSRNILVKPDLSCCICDFGLAMKIMTPRLSDPNSSDHEEHLSLADVGTLRYMAPEVLEGSVNLYDCKTSLTEVDVYSLGLVFWEVATRCHELYQGMPTPEYRLPFEAEVGVHPSFEDMQVLVSRNKSRPAFPDVWKDSNLAVRSMKDTIEECWDQDPEARVSAVCVEERSREMGVAWDIWHRSSLGTTPAINYSHLKDLEDKALVQHNATFSRSSGSMSSLPKFQASEPTANVSSRSTTDSAASNSTSTSHPKEQSTSTATIQTMMTLSPSDTHESTSAPTATTGKPDCNLIYARMNAARQPHQGQNPTVERNTHKNSDEELAVEGNTLVNKRQTSATQNGNVINSGDLVDSTSRNTDTGVLIQNDILDFQNQNLLALNATVERQQNGRLMPVRRPQQHISFVPNPVDVPDEQALTEPMLVRPKKQNIPSNGDIAYAVSKAAPSYERTSRLGQLKKQIIGSKPPFRKFSFPSLGWRTKHNPPNDSVKNGGRGNGEVRHLSSEVCLVDGRTVVRPNSLALNGVCVVPSQSHILNRTVEAAGPVETRHEPPEGSRLLVASDMADGCLRSSISSGDGSTSEGVETVTKTGAKPMNGESSATVIHNGGVQPARTSNADELAHLGAVEQLVDLTNKSSFSEESVGDNMGYEASCSPVAKVNTCMV